MSRYEKFFVSDIYLKSIGSQPTSTDTVKVKSELVTSGTEAETFWAGAPKYIPVNNNDWIYINEDFVGNNPVLDASANEPTPPWQYVDDGTATYALSSTDVGGVLGVTTATGAADSGVTMRLGGHNDAGNVVEFVKNSGNKLWFEARVKMAQATNTFSAFVGLAAEDAVSVEFLADAGDDFGDYDLIGFNILEAAGATMNASYQTSGGTFGAISGVATNASDWHTLGLFFDGVETITFFVDGVANSTTLDLDTSLVPDGEEMAPLIAIKTHTTDTKTLYIDWVTCVMERGL